MEKHLHKKEESEKRWYTNNEKQSSGAVFVRTLDRWEESADEDA